MAAAILLVQTTGALAADVVGSVTTVNGQPVVHAQVVVLNASGKVVATGITQADGTYSVTNLPPGDYTVKLAGVTGSGPAAAGGSEVEAQLQGAGQTINWVVGANGTALATQQAGLVNQPEVEAGLAGEPLPYGAGLTQVGNTAGSAANSVAQTVNPNPSVNSGALPAIAGSVAPAPPAPPKPSSPSS